MKWFLIFFFVVQSMRLNATSMVPLSLETLTQESDAIVLARVIEQESFYRMGHVWSRFHFIVEDYIEGSGPQLLSLVQPGGSKDQFKTLVAGVRDLDIGKKYCLFLWLDNTGNYQIIGYSQGSFETIKDSDGSLKIKQSSSNIIFSKSTVSKNLMTIDSSGKHLAWRKFMFNGEYNSFKELIQAYAKDR